MRPWWARGLTPRPLASTLSGVKPLRAARPLLLAALLVCASQPALAATLAPSYPSPFTLIAEPAPGNDPLLGLIGQAQARVLVESYALTDPHVVAALEEARGRGVDVRVMVDPHSASSGAPLAQLARKDVWGRRGNPLYTGTGESAVVIDRGTLALSNAPLTEKARTAQRRFLVVDRDPMDAQQAASVFYDDWERRLPATFGHQTVLAPPDYQTRLIALISASMRSLDIMGETLDSPGVQQALGVAVLRGVKVRVLLDPGVARSVLLALVGANAEPRLLATGFSGSVVGADGAQVLLGSAALSDVSLQRQREMGLLLPDPGVASAYHAAFEADWAAATRVGLVLPTATPDVSPTPPLAPVAPSHTRTPIPGRPAIPTRTPRPTAPPPPSATPSALGLAVGYAPSVRIGTLQQILVHTNPGTTVSVNVTYPDGTTTNPGTRHGPVGDAGIFADSWTIAPNVQTGTANVIVTAAGSGKTRQQAFSFRITL